MKNFKCVCCVMSCVVSCALKAEAQEQSNVDSVLNNTAVYNDYNEMYKSSAHLLHGDTARVGLVSLDYNSTSGSYHKSQEGQSNNNIKFQAKGIATLNKVKLSGAFNFQQYWIDSMNNTMSGTFDHFIPSYFFATKHGKYERQNYNATTQIAYTIIPEKLALGVGVDYTYNWMTRSVDPRPEVKSHEILVKPELVYHTGKHNFGLKYIWGYGSDYTTLKFKNSLFTQSLAYPERIFYNNQGFGFVTIKDANMRIYRTSDFQGAYFSYNLKEEKLDIHTSISYTNVYHQSSQTEAIKEREIYSVFEENRWHFDAIATYSPSTSHTHQAIINYKNRTGGDWNKAFDANSYNAENENIDFSYAHYHEYSKGQLYYGTTLSYAYLMQSDAATSHWLVSKRFTPSLFVGGAIKTIKANYALKISGGYTHPVETSYNVPSTQENVFSTNILYPDYVYYNFATVHYGAEFKIGLNKLINKNAINIIARLQNESVVKDANNTLPKATWMPSGNRLSFGLGITINM